MIISVWAIVMSWINMRNCLYESYYGLLYAAWIRLQLIPTNISRSLIDTLL